MTPQDYEDIMILKHAALDRGDRYIIENLCDIRDACDAIASMCSMIDELDTVEDNDALGKIVFDPTDDAEQK